MINSIENILFTIVFIALIYILIRGFSVGSKAQFQGIDGTRTAQINTAYFKFMVASQLPLWALWSLWYKFHWKIPFYNITFSNMLYDSGYLDKNEDIVSRIIDNILLSVDSLAGSTFCFLILYFVLIVTFLVKYMLTEDYIDFLMNGNLTKGIRRIDDPDLFKSALESRAIEHGKRFNEELKKAGMTPQTNNKEVRIKFGVDSIPFYKFQETRGTIFFGGAGSGKTLLMYSLLTSFIKWEKANYAHTHIYYDAKAEDFYTKLYRHGTKDVLFFPGHKLSAKWNPFREFIDYIEQPDGTIKKVVDHDKAKLICLFWIPKGKDASAETWDAKGRLIASAAMITVAFMYEKPSMKDFIDFTIMYNTREKLKDKIEEQEVAFTIAGINIASAMDETEGGANSYTKFEEAIEKVRKLDLYYTDEEATFSVKEFMRDHTDLNILSKDEYMKLHPSKRNFDKRLFLVCKPKQREYLSPIFRIIFELSSIELLSLRNDLERRILFCLDEIASLGAMNTLIIDLPEQGRSKGFMGIFGLQTISSWYDFFGKEGADRALANINTKIFMELKDNETRNFVQTLFGKSEYEKTALSASEQKGSGNISYVKQDQDVIKPGEFSCLDEVMGFYSVFNLVTRTFAVPDQSKTRVDWIPDDNPKLAFKTEFKKETEEMLAKNRETVLLAIIHLLKNSNAVVSPTNIEKYTRLSAPAIERLLKIINEEKDQIKKAIKQFIAIDKLKINEISIPGLALTTGLSEETCEIHWMVIYTEQQLLINNINKVIFTAKGKSLDKMEETDRASFRELSVKALGKSGNIEEDIADIITYGRIYPETLLAQALDESQLSKNKKGGNKDSSVAPIQGKEEINKMEEFIKSKKAQIAPTVEIIEQEEIPEVAGYEPEDEEIELIDDVVEEAYGPSAEEIEAMNKMSDEEIEKDLSNKNKSYSFFD